MAQRVAYGALAIVVLVLLVQLDAEIGTAALAMGGVAGELLARGSVLPLAFLIVVLKAAWELDALVRARGAEPHRAFACFMTAFLFLCPWLSAGGLLGNDVQDREGLYWPLTGILFSFLGTGALTLLRGQTAGAVRDVSATMVIILYSGFLPSFALQIRCGIGLIGQIGAWLFLFVLLTTKAADIGAYFGGSLFGRHKLAPKISPGKTIEGAAGGLIFSASVAVLLGSLGSILSYFEIPIFSGSRISEIILALRLPFEQTNLSNTLDCLIFGFAISAAGQIGDLVESCFKRDAGAKDSGRILPQYGGILDLIDSPVASMPAAWFLLSEVWRVL